MVLSSLFGLAAFHLGFALLGRFIRGRVTTDALDTVASALGVLTCLAALVLFSFLAPGPLDLLYR